MNKRLPVVNEPTSSLRKDGARNWVHPADVRGRFTRLRRIVFAILIAVYLALPWVNVGGHPAMFLDIPRRKFYFVGLTFNAQDAWLAFFLVTGVGFALIVLAATMGRVWCGYACPQTVFLEGVYRRIERWIEGPRNARIKRNAGPWTFDKVWRKGLKHFVFVSLSLFLSHVFLSYFTSLPALFDMVRRSPAEHPEAFGWVLGVSAALYGNFAFFREQLCLIVCPYGRLQSVLMDRDSVIVGYDEARGEPRGKAKDPNAGDCVACQRCVVVCPTGIDIREGLQLDCIGCANCIDACDEVMAKLGRAPGLIRYDSLNGLEGQERRFWRPRMALYGALGVAGIIALSLGLQSHSSFEANLMRLRGAPFLVTPAGEVMNSLEVHLVNKSNETRTFEIVPARDDIVRVEPTRRTVEVGSLDSVHVPVFVRVDRDQMQPGLVAGLRVQIRGREDESKTLELPVLGPER